MKYIRVSYFYKQTRSCIYMLLLIVHFTVIHKMSPSIIIEQLNNIAAACFWLTCV